MKALLLLLVLLAACIPRAPEWPGLDKNELWYGLNKPLMMHANPIYVHADSALYKDTELVMERWNRWMHMKLFIMTDNLNKANVYVMESTTDDPLLNGRTRWYADDKKLVEMYKPYKGATLLHEFGHVLGLDHDHDNRYSIMYPWSYKRIGSDLETKDRLLLRAYYGNELWRNQDGNSARNEKNPAEMEATPAGVITWTI